MKVDKQNLFQQKLSEIYPFFDRSALENERKTSFRVTGGSDPHKVKKELELQGFNISAGPFNYSYVVESLGSTNLSRTSQFENHEIYIQSLSSMYAVEVLNPQVGENIIDLCAAPGSKTSLIAYITGGEAEVTACENNTSRFFSLQKNLKDLGYESVRVIKENAADLQYKPDFVGIFDKVLADVPCSNEGLIRRPSTYDFSLWNPKTSDHLPALQKKILASGINLLKKGGELVYSTCTYSPKENEEVVEWALKKFPNVKLKNTSCSFKNCVTGFTEWKDKKFSDEMRFSVRILPNELFDGFFVASLLKF